MGLGILRSGRVLLHRHGALHVACCMLGKYYFSKGVLVFYVLALIL